VYNKLFICPPRFWGFDVSPPHDLTSDQPLPESIRQFNYNQKLLITPWLRNGRLAEGSAFVKPAFFVFRCARANGGPNVMAKSPEPFLF
jgi:hypothetical protein